MSPSREKGKELWTETPHEAPDISKSEGHLLVYKQKNNPKKALQHQQRHALLNLSIILLKLDFRSIYNQTKININFQFSKYIIFRMISDSITTPEALVSLTIRYSAVDYKIAPREAVH